jgi:hypothetical protein
LKHIKHWRVIGELTEDELRWLYINKFDVEVERDEIHYTVFGGRKVTMPDVTKINIQSFGNTAETMLCLKFGNRIVLFFERWVDEFHGCTVQF